ncbi:MAG: tRNA (adenosine(37)-N6)-dimethylallyltransferase MiaA [Burkholderiaceae bacterium]|nr:tRNA (adenosine(37)-N6)-dimethylallyltransferase MiaA [Burkholderiaceae bacterium]
MATLPNAEGAASLQPIYLAGPTASGKTACAMALARDTPMEIISVDSALVYRGMDIGTAKPTQAERAAVPHHLIDIRDPRQAYSAAEFAVDARRLISEIQARGRRPLLVGGTMLYFKALLEGMDAMPGADPALRAELEAQAAREGWAAMHAELARVDAPTAARLSPTDSQRIQRALEVYRASGRPLSSFHSTRSGAGAAAAAEQLISLEPTDRAWLHARIAQRFDAMLAAGLVDEVRALRARGDLSPNLPSMRCVGYRQTWEALDAGTLEGLRDKGIFATRQLARRQLTWLRAMPGRRAIACDAPDAIAQLLHTVRSSHA